MSNLQDENAILVDHIRELQGKIEKDEKEFSDLKVRKGLLKVFHQISEGKDDRPTK